MGKGRRKAASDEDLARHIANAMAAWADGKGKKPSRSISKIAFFNAKYAVLAMSEARDWRDMRPIHFVAVYAKLHEDTYGIPPGELEIPKERSLAVFAASRMLGAQFEGDTEEMVSFMHWVWIREKLAERARRSGQRADEFRITWKYQFGPGLLTNYRKSMLIAGGRA